jgi:hypothetical protein
MANNNQMEKLGCKTCSEVGSVDIYKMQELKATEWEDSLVKTTDSFLTLSIPLCI